MKTKIDLAIALENYLASVADGKTEGSYDIDPIAGNLYITLILSDPQIGKSVSNHFGAFSLAQNLASN